MVESQRKPRALAQKDEVIRSQDVKKPPAQQRSEQKPQSSHASPSVHENSQDQLLPLPTKRQKRVREAEDPTNQIPIGPPHKQFRSSSFSPFYKQKFNQGTANGLDERQRSHISHWTEQKTWPKEYFVGYRMHPLLARRKSTLSLQRKRSETSFTPLLTPSDQRPREEKCDSYRYVTYPDLPESLGDSYMRESPLGITDASKALLENLLKKDCATPKETLFDDGVFDKACRNVKKKEARLLLDFARLMTPSPEGLAASGATDLDILVESVNEGWNNSMPITSTRPQPDFALCFSKYMFSDDQLRKIEPLLGDLLSLSGFRATHYMLFPFLTCEVKCGNMALTIADRQNVHSMTLAVRGIVELFKLGKRENELHRELLTVSISHNYRTVRLYGYYPVLDGSKTRTYRYEIDSFTSQGTRARKDGRPISSL